MDTFYINNTKIHLREKRILKNASFSSQKDENLNRYFDFLYQGDKKRASEIKNFDFLVNPIYSWYGTSLNFNY